MSNILYKFAGFEGGKKISLEHTLKFSNPSAFNDPFDCYEHLLEFITSDDSLIELLNRKIYLRQPDEEKLSILQLREKLIKEDTVSFDNPDVQAIFTEAKKNIWICCFSRTHSNIIMWSHYAEKHNGFCIGFDKSGLQEHFYKMSPVIYCKDLQKRDYFINTEAALQNIVFTKAIDWSYEEEERIYIPKTAIVKIIQSDENNEGISNFPGELIKKIFIGVNNEYSKDKLMEKLEKKGLCNIEVHKMKLKTSSFDLEFE